MATRKKQKQDSEAQEAESDLTPMIDVTFLLLIFFVLNVKFKVDDAEIQTYLPTNKGIPNQAQQIELCDVRLKLLWFGTNGETDSEKGSVVVKVDRVAYNAPGELDHNDWSSHQSWTLLLRDLENIKAAYKGPNPNGPPVTIDARQQVPYRYVVKALDQLLKAGYKNIEFAAPERR